MTEVLKIILPWFPKELGANYRGDRRSSTRIRKNYKYSCFLLTKEALKKYPEFELSQSKKVKMDIIFNPPRNNRDLDNCLFSVKYGIDSMAEAIGVNDKIFRPITIDFGESNKEMPSVFVTLIKDENGNIGTVEAAQNTNNQI